MRKIYLLIGVFLTGVSAQSFFNLNGLGEITPPADARYMALGNPFSFTYANPGNFVELKSTSVKTSLTGSGIIGQQNHNQRALGEVKPSAVYAAVPVFNYSRIVLSVDTRFNQDFDVWSESLADTTWRYHIVSRGGIYGLNIGLVQSLLNHICVGVQFGQLLGGSRENWHYWAEGNIATDTIEINYTARNFRLGSSIRFAVFSLCGTYDLPLNLTANRFMHIHGVTTDSLATYHLHIPSIITFGFSAVPYRKTEIYTALEIRNWAGASINNSAAGYRNTCRGSIGLEYEPIPAHPFRLGYSIGNWYCSGAGEEPILETGVHFGTGFPLPKFGAVDVAGEIIRRTSRTQGSRLEEIIGRLNLTLAYEEVWSKRTRRWGY
uniref:DUF5723 domain-containing protein n=1 Tax=candidate division WOR-3 bacterium TaxID=2052148 RepID=A0A7V3PT42_UNCW3